MGRINILGFDVANLIAAGEVVDRPASAIKELVENAVDSGATSITVEIQRGGVRFMRVTDNGCGILPEDLPLAVRRHATSKIKNAEDLDGILTLGFRGEALAAIGSVSDLRIISKVPGSVLGASIEVRSGIAGSVTEQGAPDGTTVIAENLFANVPARLKFLKRDITEGSAVASVVEKAALSHPDISFRFISDGSLKLETTGDGSLAGVIKRVYGKEYAEGMIELPPSEGPISVTGFITSPEAPRGNRNYQIFFINGRYVKSRTASSALEQAYTSYIPPERFPGCVINIKMSPGSVDVNVHPSKLEVKFSDDRPVFDSVYRAVRDALTGNTKRPVISDAVSLPKARGASQAPLSSSFVPVFDPKDGRRGDGNVQLSVSDGFAPSGPRPGTSGFLRDFSSPGGPSAGRTAADYPVVSEKNDEETDVPDRGPVLDKAAPRGNSCSAVGETETPPVPQYRIVGEIFNTYVIVEKGSDVLIFDKHASHERLNFEKLRRAAKSASRSDTLLAVPVRIPLSGEDADALEENENEIESLGFSFSRKGNTLTVTAIPADLDPDESAALLEALADALRNGTGTVDLIGETAFEKALYQASCKASIKGGRVYPEGYTLHLVDELMRHPEITYCPHGRPVAYVMSKREFDRRFGRI